MFWFWPFFVWARCTYIAVITSQLNPTYISTLVKTKPKDDRYVNSIPEKLIGN